MSPPPAGVPVLCAHTAELPGRPAGSSCGRRVIVLSGRGGGRWDSDGGRSQVKVYPHVGDLEKGRLGSAGAGGVGAGVAGRERKWGVGKFE